MSVMMKAPRAIKRLARQIDRSMQIVHYHPPGQLFRRLANRLRDRWPRQAPSVISQTDARLGVIQETPPLTRRSTNYARDLELGTVTLLNQPHLLGWPIQWNASENVELSPLAEFHLHYHEFLLDAAQATNDVDPFPIITDALIGWLDVHENGTRGAAWHPYCISRRIPVWLALLSMMPIEGARRTRIERSLASQADELLHRLERDLGGNHLWENARALVIAGAAFEGPRAEEWFEVGGSLLDHCIAEQILPGGEHFERTPAYQAELAWGLEEAAFWSQRKDPQASTRWRSVASQMSTFLDNIRHPDGNIPLFGDSTLDPPRARSTSSLSADHTKWIGDYYVRRTDGRCLIFDTGNMAEDSLPAHAHADLTQFELSIGQHRFLVDSGVVSYTGPKRSQYRQSNAHQVLMIDGRNLADIWSSFRMGHRGRVTHRSEGRLPYASWVQVGHDAYRRVGVPHVARVWLFLDHGDWYCLDVALPSDDRPHAYNSMLHWAPEVQLTNKPGGWIASVNGTSQKFTSIGPASIQNRQGVYAERFSIEQSRAVTELRWVARGFTVSGWRIGNTSPSISVSLEEVCGSPSLIVGGYSKVDAHVIPLHQGRGKVLDLTSMGD